MPAKFPKIRLDRAVATPAYVQLYEALRHRIRAGELAPGAAFPSERAMIESLGITRPTLRKGFDLLLKDGLVRRQQGVGCFVADTSGWKTESASKTIALVRWNRASGGYLAELCSLVCGEAMQLGIDVRTIDGSDDPDHLARQVAEERIDGVAALPTVARRHLDALGAVDAPKVIFEIRLRRPGLDHVVIDSYPGVTAGVAELIRLGHRQIAYVGGLITDRDVPGGTAKRLAPDSEFRFGAYRQALDGAGIAYDPDWYAEVAFEPEDAARWVSERKAAGRLPTAIVAFDDAIARDLIAGCRANQLSVPEDVSVLGFGDTLRDSVPSGIATATIDLRAMAQLAVRRLEERARNGGVAGVTLAASTTFKPGASIGPAPRNGASGARRGRKR